MDTKVFDINRKNDEVEIAFSAYRKEELKQGNKVILLLTGLFLTVFLEYQVLASISKYITAQF